MALGNLSEKLELLISADPSQGVSAMQRFATATDKSVTQAESSLKRLSSTALKVGGAGIGVGGLLTQMAAGDIEAANQLKSAVGAVGQSYDDFSHRIDAAAESQVRFGHTDEEVNGALATLTLAYNDTNAALNNLQLATDLAARKHISLQSAAEAVAKAHGGSARLFKEFGIQVETNSAGTKDYDAALTKLADKLQGQAAAGADTLTGRLKALRAEVENQVSAFGQKWGPTILAGSTLVTAFGAATLAAVAAPLALGAAFIYGTQHATEFNISLQGLADPTASVVTNFDKIIAAANLTDTSLYDVGKTLAEQSIPVAQAFADKLDATGKSSRDVRQAIQDVESAHQAAAEATEANTKKTDTYGDSMKRLKDVISETKKAQQDLTNTLKGETDPMFAIIDAADRQAESQRNVIDKTAALTWAIALHGRNSTEAATAQRDLNDANVNAVRSASDLTQAQLALEQAVKDGTTSVDNARWTLQTWVDQGLITQGQADGIIGKFDDLKGKADELNGTQISIAITFDAQQAEKNLDEWIAFQGAFAAQARNYGTPGQSISGVYVSPNGGVAAPRRAMGGTGFPGQSYFIEPGTHGEFFTPSSTGWFTPKDKMGGGSSSGINQTFVMPPNADIAEAASRGTRRALILSRR